MCLNDGRFKIATLEIDPFYSSVEGKETSAQTFPTKRHRQCDQNNDAIGHNGGCVCVDLVCFVGYFGGFF